MENNHCSTIIKKDFLNRKSLNPQYSMRAYSRKLGVSPSKMSEVLTGKQGLSEVAATKIAERINLFGQEKDLFIFSAILKSSKSKKTQLETQSKINAIKSKQSVEQINENELSLISDWINFALIELIQTHDFKFSIAWMSGRLRVSEEAINFSLSMLVKAKFIQIKNNKINILKRNFKTTDGIASADIRKVNTEILELARHAVLNQSILERQLSTLTIGLNTEILPEVFQMISEFRSNLHSFILTNKKNTNSDQVYCFSSQLFKLTTGDSI